MLRAAPAVLLLLHGVFSGSDEATTTTNNNTPYHLLRQRQAATSRVDQKKIKFIKWNPTDHYPLNVCEGDCDKDSQCAGDLVCFQRDANEEVPGCTGAVGESDKSSADICIRLATDTDTASPSISSSPTPPPTTAEPTVDEEPTIHPTGTPSPSVLTPDSRSAYTIGMYYVLSLARK